MPPTIHALLDDPVFKAMFKRPPPRHPALAWGEPWLLWAETHDGRWGRKLFATYPEVWARAVACIRDRDKFRDVSIVSRRVLYPPPALASWHHSFEWCSRCRRPTEFRLRSPQHHAMKEMVVISDDEPYRCHYCGIRRLAMPSY